MDTEAITQAELKGSEPAPVQAGALECRADGAPSSDVRPIPGEPATNQRSPQDRVPEAPPTLVAPSLWPQRLSIATTTFYEWLSQPRVRLSVTGVILLLTGGVLVTNSVWTLPLVIVGALMVAIAWIGRRLNGRFAIEWGETGTQLEFRAKIAAPPAPPATQATQAEAGALGAHRLEHKADSQPAPPEMIEGVARTVEIEVAELEALIAAAETAAAEPEQSEATVQATRSLRVAYGGSRSSDVAR